MPSKLSTYEKLAIVLGCPVEDIGRNGRFYWQYQDEGTPLNDSFTRGEIEVMYLKHIAAEVSAAQAELEQMLDVR